MVWCLGESSKTKLFLHVSHPNFNYACKTRNTPAACRMLPPDYDNISTPCRCRPNCCISPTECLTWFTYSLFSHFSLSTCTVPDSASLKGLGYGEGSTQKNNCELGPHTPPSAPHTHLTTLSHPFCLPGLRQCRTWIIKIVESSECW